jgi:hypothetical protein
MRRLHVFATIGKNADRAKRGKCAVVWLGEIVLRAGPELRAALPQVLAMKTAARWQAGSIAGFGAGILPSLWATRAGLIRHGVQVRTALLEQAA